MDFIVSDLLSAAPTATSDGPVRAARSASFSGPTVRKSFSSVLQGVRGEEKKGNSQEADSSRGFHKVEDRPDSKQAKGPNSGAPQMERSETIQASASDGEQVDDSQSQTVDRSQDKSESALPQSNSGSAAEGPMFVSMASASVSQAGAEMMVSELQKTHNGLPVSDCECGPAEASSRTPMMSDTTVRPAESRVFEKGTTGLPSDVPGQAKDAAVFLKGAEPQVKQPTELEGFEGEHEVKGNATDSMKTHAVIEGSVSGGTISSSDHNIARLVQANEGKLVPESQLERNVVVLDRVQTGVDHDSTDNQAPLLMPAHEGQGDAGPRTQGIAPHGQPLVVDQEELFSQSGHEHDGRQQGHPETKLFQGTAVDLPSMNGRTTEQYAAVAQSQTNTVPTAPAPAATVPPAQPAFPVPDLTQTPTPSLLRSVVLEVAQPELGHVNIRVAMMNESVHAHFLTDRVEVGQFLVNGQDRLQTTLQASGLDMGQFRVDIDRQNGGRSFQQGLFQEQGQSGHQGSQGVAKEQAQGWPDNTRSLLQGRLNLVA